MSGMVGSGTQWAAGIHLAFADAIPLTQSYLPARPPGRNSEASNENNDYKTEAFPQPASIDGRAGVCPAAGRLQPVRRGTRGAPGRACFLGSRFIGSSHLGAWFLDTGSDWIRFGRILGTCCSCACFRRVFFVERTFILDDDSRYSGGCSSYFARQQQRYGSDRRYCGRRQGNQPAR